MRKLSIHKTIPFTLLLGSLLVTSRASAIVNIEDLRLDDSVQGVSGSFTVNFNGKSGNTDNLAGSTNIGLQYVHHQQVELLLASYEYSEVNGKGNDESKFLHLRHTDWFKPHWAWEAYTQYEAQPYVLDKVRTLLGAGGRWKNQFKQYKGILGGSIFYEKEEVDLQRRETFEVGRFNWMAEGQYAISKQAKMGVSLFFQPKVDEWKNNRSIVNWTLSTQVVSTVSMTMSVNYRHDSQPYLDLKADDWQYSMGINYQFK
ncbi:DUF481 domain-containing protein [Galenea microaerophila]